MGREVRRVPKNWEHPKDERGQFTPLMDGYAKDIAKFKEIMEKKGVEEAIEYFGGGPMRENYMPEWPENERTHLMMYEEDCTEGTPISPAFETPEELARWLADNKASAFGSETATYEQWLSMCKQGWAPSMVIDGSGLRSGVADSSNNKGQTPAARKDG